MSPSAADPDRRQTVELDAAAEAVARGELVVTPTDTVYGIAADCFSPAAVNRLLAAKGRGRQSPPPVLIPDASLLETLAVDLPPSVHALARTYWPGGLTIIVRSNPDLAWDLGETGGTVGLRVPDSEIARALLARTGPLAVSSANLTGQPAATTVDEARDMLGQSVAVYLDGGDLAAAGAGVASTIVDATRLGVDGKLRIVRHGALTDQQIAAVVGADLL